MAGKKEVFTLEDVDLELNGTIIGGAQSVTVDWVQENEPKHQGGSKKPFEIRDGQITIAGTIEQFFLDKESITELIDLENGNNPYFNIVGVTKNKTPQRKITVIDAKFKGFSLNMGLTDDTIMTKEFDALDVKVD